ncbi:hypothetical protein SAMN02745146_1227 [Hymenobacter daecheongensis DSM 21074]|uniref:PH domain-containing protein n=1 Tax=Hymenobacter daecheongensis DSM 21074 TaxID=1121955 RepID=A0A1M6CQG6_9BACT|nr:hypothetical protein [Hymenobacter daecheongensis]SHI62978.1 hypothetical protein SAMN02745146_1227 [Hymenobacter daecheongensis DSM 21074]
MPSANAPTLPALFSERQDFWRPWWWLALAIPLALGLAFFLGLRALPAPTGLKWVVLLVPALLTAGVFALLRLETHFDAEGISYRLYPMGWRRLAWADVKSAHVRKYSPLGEYGGWGIKGFSTSNYAYNVSGSYGLQLELKNGHRVLLGTQQPEALQQVVSGEIVK